MSVCVQVCACVCCNWERGADGARSVRANGQSPRGQRLRSGKATRPAVGDDETVKKRPDAIERWRDREVERQRGGEIER